MRNRNRILNELTRRYAEVSNLLDRGVSNGSQANQLLSSLAHYINYTKSNRLTKRAINRLLVNKLYKEKNEVLLTEGTKALVTIKSYRDIAYEAAVKAGVDFTEPSDALTDFYATGKKQIAAYFRTIDSFLNQEGSRQKVSEIPSNILYLTQILIDLQSNKKIRKLETIKNDALRIRNDIEEKLKLQGVFLDYTKIDDFRHLEIVWNEVYKEKGGDELVIFFFEFGDIFKDVKYYDIDQQRKADEFIEKYRMHIVRFHNYMIDYIEDAPWYSYFTAWLIEHLGPTLVSVIILLLIYIILNKITNGAITYDSIKDYLP